MENFADDLYTHLKEESHILQSHTEELARRLTNYRESSSNEYSRDDLDRAAILSNRAYAVTVQQLSLLSSYRHMNDEPDGLDARLTLEGKVEDILERAKDQLEETKLYTGEITAVNMVMYYHENVFAEYLKCVKKEEKGIPEEVELDIYEEGRIIE